MYDSKGGICQSDNRYFSEVDLDKNQNSELTNLAPVDYCPELDIHVRDFQIGHHMIGSVLSQLYLPAWLHELRYETDNALSIYIEQGVRFGFHIVDCNSDIPCYDRHNYSSSLQGESGAFIDDLIRKELAQGKYIRSEVKPRCIHALGAVPKTDGSYRPITDCRQPLWDSVNNYMCSTALSFSYNSVDRIADCLTRGSFMATIDIAQAYRSVNIHPDHWDLQGIRWCVDGVEQYLMDTRICFGLKCAPFIFTRLSEFVVRCMHHRGFLRVFQYLDDFIVMEDSYTRCQEAQMVLIRLLHSLGFMVAWKKVTSPSQVTRFLGIVLDSFQMKLLLPEQKLQKLYSELRFFDGRRRATRCQLQRLCGLLVNAKCKIISF